MSGAGFFQGDGLNIPEVSTQYERIQQALQDAELAATEAFDQAQIASSAATAASGAVSDAIAALTTTDVPEGDNLYFTDERAASASPVQSVAGRTGAVSLTTSDVQEGDNLYHTAERAAAAAPVQSVAAKTGDVVLTKADVGLSNVDNTSDLNKPISTATQTALDLKANAADVVPKSGGGFTGYVGIGTSTFDGAGDRRLQVGGTNTASQALVKSSTTHLSLYASSGTDAYISVPTGGAMRLGHGPADGASFSDGIVLDANGNLLVGVTSGSTHYIDKSGAAVGTRFLVLGGRVGFDKVDGSSWSASATAIVIGNNTTTGRSVNAAGTLNASGADYAEYMRKAEDCGIIQPGGLCGVNADGLLTDNFAEAHTFVIKSTDPAYVGNDTWSRTVGPRPDQPALDLPAYTGPDRPADDDPDYEAKMAAWEAAQESHTAAIEAARAAHATAMQQYGADLADFEARLEAERVKWDRIAFSGQVPVNVYGATPGQYIEAIEAADGTIAGGVSDTSGPNTVGKVWKVLGDGRAWVAVKIG